MSNAPNLHAHRQQLSRAARARRTRYGGTVAVAVGGVVLAAVLFAVALAGGNSGTGTTGTGGVDTAALAATGETNDMGLPVVGTPGSARGAAAAAGIRVTGANWDLGRVPLNVAVRPTWTLRNTGTSTVTLGQPKAEVRKGCCPGPLTLGAPSLAPGASTTLTFELAMHPGMDGPHDLVVHVPVQDGTDHLTLGVTGDFRN